MSKITSIMISVFGNNRVIPDTDVITFLMNETKGISGLDFLPNINNSAAIDINTGNIIQVPNLSLRTPDGLHKIISNGNRIDYISVFSDQTESDYDEQLKQGVLILQSIISKAEIVANRFALNIDLLCSNNIKDFISFDFLPFYKGREIKEWSSRTNSDCEILINDQKETLNVITTIEKRDEASVKTSNIRCHFDINTIAQNNDFRFKGKDLDSFIFETKRIANDIKNQIDGAV